MIQVKVTTGPWIPIVKKCLTMGISGGRGNADLTPQVPVVTSLAIRLTTPMVGSLDLQTQSVSWDALPLDWRTPPALRAIPNPLLHQAYNPIPASPTLGLI